MEESKLIEALKKGIDETEEVIAKEGIQIGLTQIAIFYGQVKSLVGRDTTKFAITKPAPDEIKMTELQAATIESVKNDYESLYHPAEEPAPQIKKRRGRKPKIKAEFDIPNPIENITNLTETVQKLSKTMSPQEIADELDIDLADVKSVLEKNQIYTALEMSYPKEFKMVPDEKIRTKIRIRFNKGYSEWQTAQEVRAHPDFIHEYYQELQKNQKDREEQTLRKKAATQS